MTICSLTCHPLFATWISSKLLVFHFAGIYTTLAMALFYAIEIKSVAAFEEISKIILFICNRFFESEYDIGFRVRGLVSDFL